MESERPLDILFYKFLDRRCSAGELQELFYAFDSTDEAKLRASIAKELERAENENDSLSALQLTQVMLVNDMVHQQTKVTYSSKRLLAAAAILCLFSVIGFAVYRYKTERLKEFVTIPVPSPYVDDVMPPSKKAVLRTSEGTTFVLSTRENGIASEDDAIHYHDGEEFLSLNEVHELTLETSKAAHYQARLPDGTRVWLNASSSITYPSKFKDDERFVTVQGELFLDVFKDPKKPFVVQVGSQRIKVLGTNFNVNSYADDGLYYITLINGLINIKPCASCKYIRLLLGYQAVINNELKLSVREVNVKKFCSWKSGVLFGKSKAFCFRAADRALV